MQYYYVAVANNQPVTEPTEREQILTKLSLKISLRIM